MFSLYMSTIKPEPIAIFCCDISLLFKSVLTKLFDLFAAIATVVTVAEILKNNGLAVEKSKNFFFPCTADYISSSHRLILINIAVMVIPQDALFCTLNSPL